MRATIFAALATCVALVLPCEPAAAQTVSNFRFQVDNDYFDFWLPSHRRPDNNYTHGQIMGGDFDSAPQWMQAGTQDCMTFRVARDSSSMQNATFNSLACVQSFFTITQQIFTPVNDSPMPLKGERPYAGLLAVDFGRQSVGPRMVSTLGLRFGTTGRNSGAEAAQKAFHRLVELRHPMGWNYQVAAEPVVGAVSEAQVNLISPPPNRGGPFAVIGIGSATATNIQAGMSGGLEIRAGHNALSSWAPLSRVERHSRRAYIILGASEQWVARDLLIDGNSPATTGLVKKEPLVFQSVWGFGFGGGGYVLEYRATSHSHEYDTQRRWHRWGTIALIRGNP
jgi:hypothetical protein